MVLAASVGRLVPGAPDGAGMGRAGAGTLAPAALHIRLRVAIPDGRSARPVLQCWWHESGMLSRLRVRKVHAAASEHVRDNASLSGIFDELA